MTGTRAPSLVTRLVLGLAALSVLLSGMSALALDLLYRGLALDARKEVLDAQVIALIATAELRGPAGLVPTTLAEARLAAPGTGLYAEIQDEKGDVSWRSPSSVGSGLALHARPAAGQRIYTQLRLPDGTRLLALSLGVSWESGSSVPETWVISAAESLEPYFSQVARVRGWLAAGAVLLMILLVIGLSAVLRSGLRPLARLEAQIRDVESGQRELLGDDWPRELAGVTQNLNALLAGNRGRLARYRTTLGNLAHSLKTPIAALYSMASGGQLASASVRSELDRMQSIVDHQLRRAVLGGAGSAVASLTVAGPLGELSGALSKVYRDKSIHCALEVPADLAYPMETGDLMELAGNLLDNAFKYGRRRVRLRASAWPRQDWRRPGLRIEIEDDGPGIPPADRQRVLQRGVRADESVPGQGIGLAAAQEVVSAYAGTIELADSPLGGTAVRVQLPGR